MRARDYAKPEALEQARSAPTCRDRAGRRGHLVDCLPRLDRYEHVQALRPAGLDHACQADVGQDLADPLWFFGFYRRGSNFKIPLTAGTSGPKR
jgi:hypothetical protein